MASAPDHIGRAERHDQLFHVVGEFENGVPVVVHQPHIFFLVVRIDIDRVRPPQHAVPLGPGLLDLSFGVHADDAVLPAPVDIFGSAVRAVELSWWAGRRGVAPRQAADGKPEARPKLREVDFLWAFDVRQFAALQDEDAVRALGENAFARSPGPLFISGQCRQGLRPGRVHVVGPEDVLHAFLSRDGGKGNFRFCLRLRRRRANRPGRQQRESRLRPARL